MVVTLVEGWLTSPQFIERGEIMAYVSVPMGVVAQGEVLNSSYWTSAPTDGTYTWAQFAEGNITPTVGQVGHTELEVGDTNIGLRLDPNDQNTLKMYYNGSEIGYFGLANLHEWTSYIIFFGIDEENHRGSVWIAQRRQLDRWGYSIAGGRLIAGGNVGVLYNTELGYNWIKALMPIDYQWKSVKSLSLGNMDNYVDWRPYWNIEGSMLLSYIPDEALSGLDVGTPVTNSTEFELKSPSLEDVMVDFNDTSFTERILKLSNGNYCLIGIQSGLLSHSFQIKFYIGGQEFPQLVYTSTFSTSTGNPYLGFLIDSENERVKLNIIFSHNLYDSAYGTETRVVDYNTLSISDNDMESLYTWLYGSSGDDEYTDDEEENEIQGGDETDPVINTPLNQLGLPVKGAVGSGFIKLYDVSETQLQDLCEFMWDDSLITNLGRLFNDPREIIVGIMTFPFKPTHTQSNVNIYAGNLDTGVQGDLLDSEYESIAMGKARIPKGDSDFMSFAPYRKIKLFLPYCGEHEIDPSAVYGYTLKLTYHVSFFSGNVIAEVDRIADGSSVEEPMWFFPGQIGFQIPLSGEDFTRVISTLVQAGVTAATGYLMHNPATMVKAVGQLFSGNLAPSVQYSQGGGANSSFLSCQQPHLIFSTPKKAYDGDQDEYIGNTYHKTKLLSDCTGFTKCFDVHLEGLDATSYELEQIENWLKSGVLVHHDGSSTPSGTPSQPGFIPIHFMHCESERNVIGKKWDTPNTIEGKLLYEQSISSPVILIDGNLIGYNYCYIDLFKRFYWIKDVKAMRNNMTEVYLEVDPLQSFASDIGDCYASVDRQATDANNAFVEDPYKWTQINHDVSIVPFKSGGIAVDIDHQQDTYILTIAGT